MENKEPPENLPKWEEDFYEVLPIVCSPLTADSKVARIKKIFEKLLVAEYERGHDEGLDNRDFGAVISQVRSTALDDAIAAIRKMKDEHNKMASKPKFWTTGGTIMCEDCGAGGTGPDWEKECATQKNKIINDILSSLHALKEKK